MMCWPLQSHARHPSPCFEPQEADLCGLRAHQWLPCSQPSCCVQPMRGPGQKGGEWGVYSTCSLPTRLPWLAASLNQRPLLLSGALPTQLHPQVRALPPPCEGSPLLLAPESCSPCSILKPTFLEIIPFEISSQFEGAVSPARALTDKQAPVITSTVTHNPPRVTTLPCYHKRVLPSPFGTQSHVCTPIPQLPPHILNWGDILERVSLEPDQGGKQSANLSTGPDCQPKPNRSCSRNCQPEES